MSRTLFVAVTVVLISVFVACGLNATWSRTYHPAGWNHVDVCGLEALPGGNVLLFGSVANYDNPDNTTDVFLAEFNSDGAVVWERIHDFGDTDIPMWIAVNASGRAIMWNLADDANAIVALAPGGEIAWQKPGRFFDAVFVGEDVVLASGDSVVRLAADGSVVWVHALVNNDARFVAIDGAGNTYVAGSVAEPGQVNAEVPRVDAWLAKLDSSGMLLWESSDGAPNSSERVGGLGALPDGRVVVTTEVQLSPDYSSVVTRMYAPQGGLLWHDEYANVAAFDNYPEDLSIDADGNVLVLSISDRRSTGPWNANNDERVVTKLSATGAVQWRSVESGFAVLNRGLLVHSLHHDDRYVYATGGATTHIYDRADGDELISFDDGTLDNNYLAFGNGDTVYFATTDGNDGVVKRYERP